MSLNQKSLQKSTECTYLQTWIRRTVLQELRRSTDLLELTGFTISEFIGLLELTVYTILLDFTESIGTSPSTVCTGLVQLIK